LYNVADTVHEWCLDAYHADFYQVSPSANPCAFGGARRAARGGSWRHQIVVTPCAARASLPPDFHYADFGFRWVRDLT
jgi:formylglycine-generating enzyme required for sulfatase activity